MPAPPGGPWRGPAQPHPPLCLSPASLLWRGDVWAGGGLSLAAGGGFWGNFNFASMGWEMSFAHA